MIFYGPLLPGGADLLATAATVTGAGGLHAISNGMGDPGVAVVPQTLHTIEQGIAA